MRALLVVVGMLMASCGSASPGGSGGPGTTEACVTRFDGTESCEMAAGSEGIVCNGGVLSYASCPEAGLVGCCVARSGPLLGSGYTLVAMCFYTPVTERVGKANCLGGETWETSVP